MSVLVRIKINHELFYTMFFYSSGFHSLSVRLTVKTQIAGFHNALKDSEFFSGNVFVNLGGNSTPQYRILFF